MSANLNYFIYFWNNQNINKRPGGLGDLLGHFPDRKTL